jgi:hypothetical protein
MNARHVWAVQHTRPRSHVFPNLANDLRSQAAESSRGLVWPFVGPRTRRGPSHRGVSRPRDTSRRLQSANDRSGDLESHRARVPDPGGSSLGRISETFSRLAKAARVNPRRPSPFLVPGTRRGGGSGARVAPPDGPGGATLRSGTRRGCLGPHGQEETARIHQRLDSTPPRRA